MTPADMCAEQGCAGARLSPSGFCLAHAAEPERDAALEEIAGTGEVDLPGVPIDRDLLACIVAVLPVGEDQEREMRAANFEGAVFGDGVDLGDVRFLGDASFVGATFGERASFLRAVFSAEARFDGASFGWGTTFGETRFEDTVRFTGAKFGEGEPAYQPGVDFSATQFVLADFTRATFRSGASFGGAVFESGVFGDVSFAGETDFLQITGGISFTRATFQDAVVFQGAELRFCSLDAVTFKDSLDFMHANVGSCRCSHGRFEGEAVFQTTTFASAWFSDTAFARDASFWGCTFTEEARFGRGSQWGPTAFARDASFDEARFPQIADFGGVTIEGDASFRRAVIERERHFGPLLVVGELALVDSTWLVPADIDGRVAGSVSAPGSHGSRRDSLPSPGSSQPARQ